MSWLVTTWLETRFVIVQIIPRRLIMRLSNICLECVITLNLLRVKHHNKGYVLTKQNVVEAKQNVVEVLE